jgi:transcriptional regulator with XRE-family HTH domain
MTMAAGELLREARKRHGLTQEQLAARARTSQAAISRIERGLVSPTVETLTTLLDLMGEELSLGAHQIEYGHDRTLLRQNLARTASERIEHNVGLANFVLRNRAEAPTAAKFNPKPILRALLEHKVDFVLIGGLAGIVRGSSYPTYDVDVAYARDDENLKRLAGALRELGATLRGAPENVPFQLDARTLRNGSHFAFDTEYGSLDILSDPDGAPSYVKLKKDAGRPEELDGEPILAASLDHLIAMKEASGRTKDKLMATEYRVLADELRAPRQG